LRLRESSAHKPATPPLAKTLLPLPQLFRKAAA